MTQATTWVIGAGGLLGRHVVAALGHQRADVLTQTIPWHEPERALQALMAGFRVLTAEQPGDSWNIAWCAGRGVMSTAEAELAEEESLFRSFLSFMAAETAAAAIPSSGAMFLASSAGGSYAGSPQAPPYDERCTPRALAPYGRVKLSMEDAVRDFAATTSVPVLIGRIANLYGPGQDLSKQQGLISQMCRAVMTGTPLTVYVSTDTLRDYIYASDCADMVVAGLSGVRARTAGMQQPVVTKILASGRATSIAALLGEGRRVLKRRPGVIVKAPARQASVQARDLRLRSVVWPELDRHASTSLAVGIAKTADDVSTQIRSLRKLRR